MKGDSSSMHYAITTHTGDQLLAQPAGVGIPNTEPDDIGIGTIMVSGIDGLIDVSIPFISAWARFGDAVYLVPPTHVKPAFITVEYQGKRASFVLPQLEYYGAEEILILMGCGFVLMDTADIPRAATLAFYSSNATHEYGFWRQLVNGIYSFADMLVNYAAIPAKVRPDIRDFMSLLPMFPLHLGYAESLGFYIGCVAPFSMLDSFNIERDFRIMRHIAVKRTLSGIHFPDWFDPSSDSDEDSLWERTDELYVRNAQASMRWLVSLCPTAQEWEQRLRERAFAARSLCFAFLELLEEKARWTLMSVYGSRQCALCSSPRRNDAIMCDDDWQFVGESKTHSDRRENARNIAIILHQLAILGFSFKVTRINEGPEGIGLAVHCNYPDGCRLTTDKPIRITGATRIEEWMERLVKHSLTHKVQTPA